ncbi:hypothetical protein COT72_03505 [archaeon CG10_big_fil_rev_8_21_14_0_10_43_11]|nr:MAG: hypothetical protein COT72_03505 [archaeon CG10_big_fil_rev_8_21_14_0_10_43_11]
MKRGMLATLMVLVLATPVLAQSIFDSQTLDGGFWEPVGGELAYTNGLVVAYGFAGGGFVAVLVVIVFGGFVFYKYKYQKKDQATGELVRFGK